MFLIERPNLALKLGTTVKADFDCFHWSKNVAEFSCCLEISQNGSEK
jgi:hypothetical protein